ncbi:monooxygenase, partial [Escherichia coli]|nr:monooxygenase [Escherichia coli]
NIVAVEERDDWAVESWSHTDNPDNLRAAFAGFAPEVRKLLDQVNDVFLWGLFRHPVAPVWHNDHAAILGDAAHPTLPFMAQGANMALEDAWVLAAALAGHDDRAEALSNYQIARRERCIDIVDAASKNARNYHLTGSKRTLGHLALRVAGAVAPDMMLKRFDWIYGYDVTRLYP